jgi:uncharacterized membrane protein (DUF106 family)
VEDNNAISEKLDKLIALEEQHLELLRQGQVIQREQFEMAKIQYEKARELQQRAESLQDKGAALMNVGRKAMAVVLPVIFILIIYLSWLIFR